MQVGTNGIAISDIRLTLQKNCFRKYIDKAEDIMRTALEEKVWGVKVGGVRRSNLIYADDTTLLSSSKEELLQMISAVKEASQPRGLLLNVKKTQIMVIDNNRLDHTDFMIDGERIREVEEFVYLGSKITKECSCKRKLEDA